MGHFFVMSTRFNKCDASDFGLLPLAEDMALSPNDGSIWVKTELYNFGWEMKTDTIGILCHLLRNSFIWFLTVRMKKIYMARHRLF